MPSEAKSWTVIVGGIEKEKKISVEINRLFSVGQSCEGIEEIAPDTNYDIIWNVINNTLWPVYVMRISVIHSNGVEEEVIGRTRIKVRGRIESKEILKECLFPRMIKGEIAPRIENKTPAPRIKCPKYYHKGRIGTISGSVTGKEKIKVEIQRFFIKREVEFVITVG